MPPSYCLLEQNSGQSIALNKGKIHKMSDKNCHLTLLKALNERVLSEERVFCGCLIGTELALDTRINTRGVINDIKTVDLLNGFCGNNSVGL